MVMARIYVKCGKYNEAIQVIDDLLAKGGYFTIYNFTLDHNFDPIIGLPEFKALEQKYARLPGV